MFELEDKERKRKIEGDLVKESLERRKQKEVYFLKKLHHQK
jgi:hypothetical protein